MIDDRTVQNFIKSRGFPLAVDGEFGAQSFLAARAYLATAKRTMTSFDPAWPDRRVRVAVEQLMMFMNAIDVGIADGIPGVRYQIGLERWQDLVTFRPPPVAQEALHQVSHWPLQRDVRTFYGEPGANQTMLASPYPLYLDWDLSQSVKRFSIHEKVHDSALRVMERVLDAYGLDEIHKLGLDQFGGCLNVRRMRNGSTWSMHAWGIAIDWDADRNPLRSTSKNAVMAGPDYAKFLDLWAEEGWISLGRARNFDWMHVQAARL